MKSKYYVIILLLIGCSPSKKIVDKANEIVSFEGHATYKISTPKPDMISEEDWNMKMKEITGEQGFLLQKSYYSHNRFAADFNTGLEVGKQVYNPMDSLHYAWQLGSDTATTQDYFKESMIKIKEITELDTISIINNITCKAVKVRMTIGHAVIWYNPEILYIDGNDYKGTLFENEIISKIKTLPVKAEIPGMLNIEMTDYKAMKLEDNIFTIPEFKELVVKPTF